MEKEIIEKMYNYYNWLLSKKDCEDLVEDIMEAIKKEKYSKLIKEWLNDEQEYTDIEVNSFSLVEIAEELDEENPNIPIAILLCYLAESDSPEYQCILPIASEICLADYKLIEEGKVCQTAILKDGEWYLFSDETNSFKKMTLEEFAKQIENEMDYPGQIKVNIIRETRVVDYAK